MRFIVAVIVTYNRKKLLEECIEAIIKQTYSLGKIIIIDNNSSDGTVEMIKEKGWTSNDKFIIKRLEKNIGGAGGFYEGMKLARQINAEWIWIMDDDTIPTNTALEELVKSFDIVGENISFLASNIYGIDDYSKNYSTNHPVISKRSEDGHLTWKKYLNYGILEIQSATFVSLLISGKATKECGLPLKDYFIWGDDSEYTYRLTKYYLPAYIIGKSIVIHKRKGKDVGANILKEDNVNRINLFYYMIRNDLLNKREKYGFFIMCLAMLRSEFRALQCLVYPNVKYRWKKFFKVNRGIFAYIFRRYDYKAFKNRFSS